MSKKFTLLLGALVLLSLVLTACGGTADPEIIIQTVMVDGEVVYVEVPAEDTGEEPVATEGECCDKPPLPPTPFTRKSRRYKKRP